MGNQDPLQLLFTGGDHAGAEAVYHDLDFARYFNNSLHAWLLTLRGNARPQVFKSLKWEPGLAEQSALLLPFVATNLCSYCFTDISQCFSVAQRRSSLGNATLNFDCSISNTIQVARDLGIVSLT